MRISAQKIADSLKKERIELICIDLDEKLSLLTWRKIKQFSPDIIHYIPGPTVISFCLLKLLSVYCGKVKTIQSAYHPILTIFFREIIRFIKPNLVLYQSKQNMELFRNLGCNLLFFPSGVDLDKYQPVSQKTKIELRKKYGLDPYKFIILHIGSIKTKRNTVILNNLVADDQTVLIVGSVSVGLNESIYKNHIKSGCIVWSEYIENINEIYNISDCYIYPTVNSIDKFGRDISTSIQIPLTVLEAMACNLPVISSKFGGLPLIFNDGDGFFYAENESDILRNIFTIRHSSLSIKTREKVLQYSWDQISRNLLQIYTKVLKNEDII